MSDPIVKETDKAINAEIEASVVGMPEENRQRILALATTADYALRTMINKWDELVPKSAGLMLRDLGIEPKGDNGQYTLGQRNDAQKTLKNVPFLFAAYIDTLRKVLEKDKEAQSNGS